MRKIWARVGTTYEVTDKDYEELKEAIKNDDDARVGEILKRSNHFEEGESYLPSDCEDNPNDDDYDFEY